MAYDVIIYVLVSALMALAFFNLGMTVGTKRTLEQVEWTLKHSEKASLKEEEPKYEPVNEPSYAYTTEYMLAQGLVAADGLPKTEEQKIEQLLAREGLK